MTTKNFVPRIDGEGQVGTETKKWSKIYSNSIYVNNIIGDLNGTSDNAIKDNKNQQIDSTYIKNISVNNDTLTVTKGNGSTSTTTINNVSNATKASQDSEGNAINTTYLKRSGGTMSGDITMEKSETRRIRSGNTGVGIYFTSDEFHIYDWKNNADILGYNSTNKTLTAYKTINGTVTNATNATNATNSETVNVAQRFKFGTGGSGVVCRIFARTSLDAGDRYGNSTFIITSTGNYGGNLLGSYIVNISNRGGARMYVRELISDDTNSTTFGYYQSGSYLYFGLINADFSGECSVTPLNISSSGGHEVGNYKNDSTVPSGWRNVTIEKLAPKESPEFSGTPTAPTPSTSDNSTRVATTAFVQSLINSLKSSIGGTISAASLNTNGYVKFSNGFIIQWGKHYYNNDNPWVSFPISFTSACYSVVASFADTIATVGDALKTTDISKNRFAIDANYKYINVCYIAIGR